MMRERSSDCFMYNDLCRVRRFLGPTWASRIATRNAGMNSSVSDSGRGSGLAIVPEIDHRVGEGFDRVVEPSDALEAQQQPAELVFPGKDPLNYPEPLLEDGRLED